MSETVSGWLAPPSFRRSAPHPCDPVAGSMPGLPALHPSLRRWVTGNCFSPFTLCSSRRAGSACLAVGKPAGERKGSIRKAFP